MPTNKASNERNKKSHADISDTKKLRINSFVRLIIRLLTLKATCIEQFAICLIQNQKEQMVSKRKSLAQQSLLEIDT